MTDNKIYEFAKMYDNLNELTEKKITFHCSPYYLIYAFNYFIILDRI